LRLGASVELQVEGDLAVGSERAVEAALAAALAEPGVETFVLPEQAAFDECHEEARYRASVLEVWDREPRWPSSRCAEQPATFRAEEPERFRAAAPIRPSREDPCQQLLGF